MQTQLKPERLKELRQLLLGGEEFKKLAHYFIEGAVDESGSDDVKFKEFYQLSLQAITEENADEIEDRSGSPIEKTFLNSLILSFIRNDGFGLLVHPTFKDTEAEIEEFRKTLSNWRDFWAWFKTNKPAKSVEEFLDQEMARGQMDADERQSYVRFIFRYGYIPLDGSYHMTLQPRFPNIKIDGKEIRPDIYFWIPTKPEIKIIVECDGFAYHSDKERFKNDRQRDRALKTLGYDVLRFSGSEIVGDPVNAPHELAKYLWSRANKLKVVAPAT
jgi:hypothetical protein